MEKRVTLRSLTKRGRSCAYSEFFFGACVGAWSISLNFHLTACGVSSAQIGVLLCAGYLATAATSFFVGSVGDRRGYPFVMAIGCALMCASLIMTAIFDRLPLFYISHLAYCIGLACVMSMEFNLPLSLVEEDTRQYTYNLVLIMYFLGGIAGNTLCSAMYRIVKNEPYRVVLGLCAITYAALTVFRGTMPRRRQGTEDVKRAWGIRAELRDKRVLGYLIYGVLAFGVFTLSTGMLNLVLREWRGMTDGKFVYRLLGATGTAENNTAEKAFDHCASSADCTVHSTTTHYNSAYAVDCISTLLSHGVVQYALYGCRRSHAAVHSTGQARFLCGIACICQPYRYERSVHALGALCGSRTVCTIVSDLWVSCAGARHRLLRILPREFEST